MSVMDLDERTLRREFWSGMAIVTLNDRQGWWLPSIDGTLLKVWEDLPALAREFRGAQDRITALTFAESWTPGDPIPRDDVLIRNRTARAIAMRLLIHNYEIRPEQADELVPVAEQDEGFPMLMVVVSLAVDMARSLLVPYSERVSEALISRN